MKKYMVSIKEIHYSNREVEAESEEEAKELAADNADEINLEYSDTCDSSEWIVEEIEEIPEIPKSKRFRKFHWMNLVIRRTNGKER